MTEKYSRQINEYNRASVSLVLDSAQTEMRSDDMNINTFTQLPQIGSYVLSKCKNMAYRVLSHSPATACGQRLMAVYLADPTPVCKENQFGKDGIEIDVHNQKCGTHCIDTYYLSTRKGFRPNFSLL